MGALLLPRSLLGRERTICRERELHDRRGNSLLFAQSRAHAHCLWICSSRSTRNNCEFYDVLALFPTNSPNGMIDQSMEVIRMNNNTTAVQVQSGEWTQEKISLIQRTIAPTVSKDEFALFIARCKQTGLDPIARQIYAISRYDRAVNGNKMT